MSVIKICEICGKEFQVIPCRAKTARFCSKTCAKKLKIMWPALIVERVFIKSRVH